MLYNNTDMVYVITLQLYQRYSSVTHAYVAPKAISNANQIHRGFMLTVSGIFADSR